MRHAILAGCFLVAALIGPSNAQPTPAEPQTVRRFDLVSGILFACAPMTGAVWTTEACQWITTQFRQKAEAARVRFEEVRITADFKSAKLTTIDGFDRDKAVRVFWYFEGKDGPAGSISAILSAGVIYEPTKKDNPNIVPGQRIPINFYAQSALYDPGVAFRSAKEYIGLITDSFFESGEAKVPKQ